VLATHTQLEATEPASIELTLDVPSAHTGTGTALLLDGHDAGLVRATIRDVAGNVVNDASNLVTFHVQSGPGRVVGVHNGDAKSHEPQVASSRHAYHGLARAVVKVTVDAASASAADLVLLATEIEIENEASVRIHHPSGPEKLKYSASGHGFPAFCCCVLLLLLLTLTSLCFWSLTLS
jgi:hypothetical protein